MIVEENGPHFGAGQEVVDIITDLGQGLELVLKFRVHRQELLIGRLNLLLGCLQFFIATLQFLIGRLQLFIGRFELLIGGLQFFDGGLEIILGGLQFLFQLRNPRVGFVCSARLPASTSLPRARSLFKDDEVQVLSESGLSTGLMVRFTMPSSLP